MFISKFSEHSVEKSLDTVPSGDFNGEVFFSDSEVSLSLLSESFSISDILDALSMSGSVLNNSLSGIINSLLGDGHEVGVSSELVGFSGFGISNTLEKFSSDGGELFSESLEHIGIGEVSKLKESFDHRSVFGGFKGFTDFLERSLDFGDLDHRGGTRIETSEEFNTLIDSIDGEVGFFNESHVVTVVLGSLRCSDIHSGKSVNDELFISSNLIFKRGLEWVKDVLKG